MQSRFTGSHCFGFYNIFENNFSNACKMFCTSDFPQIKTDFLESSLDSYVLSYIINICFINHHYFKDDAFNAYF